MLTSKHENIIFYSEQPGKSFNLEYTFLSISQQQKYHYYSEKLLSSTRLKYYLLYCINKNSNLFIFNIIKI